MNLKSNVHQHMVATSCFEGQFRGIMSKQGICSTYLDIPRPNSQRNFKPNGAVLNHFFLKKTHIHIYIYIMKKWCKKDSGAEKILGKIWVK